MTAVRLTHIGGPTVLIAAHGWRVLTDPTFDSPGTRYKFGWGTSSVKTVGPARTAHEVTPLDVVVLSHDHHADNLDTAGRNLLAKAGTVVTTRSGHRRLRSDNTRGLSPWGTTVINAAGLPTLEITATPCRHGPRFSRPVAGEVIGFALRWPDLGTQALWVSGDTVLYDGVREVADRVEVDTALIHLGGVRFPVTGPLRYSMTGDEAVELIGLVKPRVAVPVHYEGWSHFREPVARLEHSLSEAPTDVRSRVRWLTPGIPETIEPLRT